MFCFVYFETPGDALGVVKTERDPGANAHA